MGGTEKRESERKALRLELNYRDANGGNFLYEHSRNISDGGIFIETSHPLPVGAPIVIRFAPPKGGATIEMEGTIAWVNPLRDGDDNPNPGMGIRWNGLTAKQRKVVEGIVRAIAILD
jgi:uncharacterized protein (TIGR02266 family)